MNATIRVIIIGGGHAGVEAAWAAANLLPCDDSPAPTVALVTLDPTKVGVMSCNPAIGGLAKGQIVREVDALGGVMGLAADASGIQFKVLNTSKGPAVHGPRAQCDKHAYAREVQRLIASRPEIQVIAGAVDELIVETTSTTERRISGVIIRNAETTITLRAPAVVLTTGTFMRGLMHTGESQTPGGRFGEAAAHGISGALRELGFELGRLKTGTPPRLRRASIAWESLEPAGGDSTPTPFSDLSRGTRFPALPQVECRVTMTSAAVHDTIRANLHRAPMYSGQIESLGPRYCPSIEDKVVRFADKLSHQVFLEPESLDDDWIYCNGISTSLPRDVQDAIVHALPGCEHAEILRYGYAVEYDMVRPHQIGAGAMTKLVDGLFLAGQINGTSGYEEAAAQGLVAGINAARRALGQPQITIGREQGYIGVLMDDLVTKTPVEPYRMFTSRAEHRLLLRADNASDRLTPLARDLGMLPSTALGRERSRRFDARQSWATKLNAFIDSARVDGVPIRELCRRPNFSPADLGAAVHELAPELRACPPDVVFSVHTDRAYEVYVARQHAEVKRQGEHERRRIPPTLDGAALHAMRAEARQTLLRFRPETFGQAGRLEGITPADLTLLAVILRKGKAGAAVG